jgi:hypothetical protein
MVVCGGRRDRPCRRRRGHGPAADPPRAGRGVRRAQVFAGPGRAPRRRGRDRRQALRSRAGPAVEPGNTLTGTGRASSAEFTDPATCSSARGRPGAPRCGAGRHHPPGADRHRPLRRLPAAQPLRALRRVLSTRPQVHPGPAPAEAALVQDCIAEGDARLSAAAEVATLSPSCPRPSRPRPEGSGPGQVGAAVGRATRTVGSDRPGSRSTGCGGHPPEVVTEPRWWADGRVSPRGTTAGPSGRGCRRWCRPGTPTARSPAPGARPGPGRTSRGR